MTLELALILGFILHLVAHSFLPAFVHALTYSLPFLLLTPSVYWLILFVSHFLIDRYRLAIYWIKLVNWNWSSTNFGYDEQKPSFISVWLMIIIDNTFHILFNSFSIYLHHL